MTGDRGYNIGLQATGVGLTTGALLWTGHARAVERVRAARAAHEQAVHDAAVAYRLDNAERLEAVAQDLAQDLGEAQAEIARLRRQLAQKQAYIESFRRTS